MDGSVCVCFFLFFTQRNNQGKRRMNSRTSLAQREDRIRRTVYVSDIDQQVLKVAFFLLLIVFLVYVN